LRVPPHQDRLRILDTNSSAQDAAPTKVEGLGVEEMGVSFLGRGMTEIAIVHLLWLLLLPSGAALVLWDAVLKRRLRTRFVLGMVLLAVSLPAVLFCQLMWPLDFLGLGGAVRVPAAGAAYTVVMVQEPGTDFYDSYFEITRSDGKITRLMVGPDADKWWGLRAKTVGTRIDFVTSFDGVVGSVDFAGGTVSGAIGQKLFKLSELHFDRKWSNGG
jgi:hypothetical protein